MSNNLVLAASLSWVILTMIGMVWDTGFSGLGTTRAVTLPPALRLMQGGETIYVSPGRFEVGDTVFIVQDPKAVLGDPGKCKGDFETTLVGGTDGTGNFSYQGRTFTRLKLAQKYPCSVLLAGLNSTEVFTPRAYRFRDLGAINFSEISLPWGATFALPIPDLTKYFHAFMAILTWDHSFLEGPLSFLRIVFTCFNIAVVMNFVFLFIRSLSSIRSAVPLPGF